MKRLLVCILVIMFATVYYGCAAPAGTGSQGSGEYEQGSGSPQQACWRCGGNGVCNNCHGSGRSVFTDDYDGACGGSGRCPACNGRGY